MADSLTVDTGSLSLSDMEKLYSIFALVSATVGAFDKGAWRMRQGLGGVNRALSRSVGLAKDMLSTLMQTSDAATGLEKGLSNFYRYAKVWNRSFSSAMDRLATSAMYLHNSLAAMAAPLLRSLAPAVDLVADRFVGLFNTVNQIFARLSGSDTYVAARRFGDAWDSETGRVRGAVSSLRRCVSGLDQLNILSSYGGGSSRSEADYGAMFEEREIEGGLAAFADSLRAYFESGDWRGLGSLLGEKVNALIAGVDWAGAGQKFGDCLNGVISSAYWLLDTVNFVDLGSRIAEFLNNAISQIDFSKVGGVVALFFASIIETFAGFVSTFDWGQFALAAADAVNGFVSALTVRLDGIDWVGLAKRLSDGINGFIRRVDWEGLGKWLNRAVNNLLDFAIAFLNNFDAKAFASGVKKALSKVDWPGIGKKLFELLGIAMEKFNELGGIGALLGLGGSGDPGGVWGLLGGLLGGGSSGGLGGLLGLGGSPGVSVGVDFQPNGASSPTYKNGGLINYLKKVFAPGADTQTRVALIRNGFTSVGDWIKKKFMGGDVEKGIGVVRDGFTSVAQWLKANWFGGDVNKPVGITRNTSVFKTVADWLKANWLGGDVNKPIGITRNTNVFKTVADWLKANWLGGDVNKPIGITRNTNVFKTVADWLKANWLGGDVNKPIGITRNTNVFKTVADWLKTNWLGGDVNKPVGVTRNTNVFKTVADWLKANWLGGDVNKPIGLSRNNWSSVDAWVKLFAGTPVGQLINLAKNGWSWVNDWVWGQGAYNPVGQLINLAKNGWDWVDTWAKQYAQTPIQQKVDLVLGKNKIVLTSDAHDKVTWTAETKARGGIITAGGVSRAFASGGLVTGGGRAGWWNGIPKYASGTHKAHGTLFAAGEAGPEILGHINGRTEILNKSQLAQTMYGAVAGGMVAALQGLQFRLPAMATGSVMPYSVSEQIARSASDLQGTLDANNEDLIQTIISVAGQIVAAVNGLQDRQRQGTNGLNAQQLINEINRRTQMFSVSPLKGV